MQEYTERIRALPAVNRARLVKWATDLCGLHSAEAFVDDADKQVHLEELRAQVQAAEDALTQEQKSALRVSARALFPATNDVFEPEWYVEYNLPAKRLEEWLFVLKQAKHTTNGTHRQVPARFCPIIQRKACCAVHLHLQQRAWFVV